MHGIAGLASWVDEGSEILREGFFVLSCQLDAQGAVQSANRKLINLLFTQKCFHCATTPSVGQKSDFWKE